MIELTKVQARRFMLAHHGLLPPHGVQGEEGVLEVVRRLGCIQYDPLNIVGTNPELVLQSRVAGFTAATLSKLLYEDRALVEGWDKNMAIYGAEDWPCFWRRREAAWRHPGKSPEEVRAIAPQIRGAIEERGPLSSIDLDIERRVDWSWAPTRLARAALESMANWGELVVHHRVHTRRVYDLAARHLPADLLSAPDPNPTQQEYDDWYVLRRVGGIGLLWNRAGSAWLGMRWLKSAGRQAALARLTARDALVPVRVEGIKPLLYLRSQDRPELERVLRADSLDPQGSILAPLDNLIWDRRLIQELFDFHYVWEVYKPAAERRYGYYVLPVLYGDRFVARFEPGRDRESSALRIKRWWWEPEVSPTPEMRSALCRCFERFLIYLDADAICVEDETARSLGLGCL